MKQIKTQGALKPVRPVSAEIHSSEDCPVMLSLGVRVVEHIAVFHSEFIASALYRHTLEMLQVWFQTTAVK